MTNLQNQPRRLPVVAAFTHILKGLAHNWRVGARHGLPWLALLALISVWDYKTTPLTADPQSVKVTWLNAVSVVLGLLANASIAVSWHRYILLDEPPSRVPPFRIDGYVWRYFARNLVIAALGVAPIIFAVSLAELMPAAFTLPAIVTAIFMVVLVQRMSTGLVATAVAGENFGLQRSLMATRKNFFPILGVLALVFLVDLAILLLMLLPSAIFASAAPGLVVPAAFIMSIPAQLGIVLMNTMMITSLYGFFVEGRNF